MVNDINRLNVKKIMTRKLENEEKDLILLKEKETLRKKNER